MKQSGIDWIGEIPDDWKISKAKTILRNKSIKKHPDAEVLSLYRDLGIVPKNSRDDNHNVTSDDTASYKFVQKGELVLNKMKTWQGSLAVSDYEGIVSPAYYVCEFTNQEIDKKYIHYLLRNKMYAQEFERLSTGLRVGQWDLNIDDFLNTPIVYPSKKATQQSIAEYLDSKCAQIDSIIEESKKSIEEYKAWKQSVIFEAVTGKNLNCKKKDSGIEWIGEIPEGWEIRQIRNVILRGKNGIKIGPFGSTLTNKTEANYPYNIYGQANLVSNDFSFTKNTVSKQVFEELKNYEVVAGDICLSMMGTIGKCRTVPKGIKQGIMDSHLIKIRLDAKIITNSYFEYVYDKDYSGLCYQQMQHDKKGSIMDGLNTTIVKSLLIPLPSITEQETIAKMLDSKCAQIDSLIAEKESLIADLTEYKKSLIFEVVTGKRRI